jgi:hypothetical protein
MLSPVGGRIVEGTDNPELSRDELACRTRFCGAGVIIISSFPAEPTMSGQRAL